MATQQPANSMDAIASLLQLFQGTKSSSSQSQTTSGGGGTSTSQTQMDDETLAGLLRSALEGNQGLAATTQGQRTAGLYNSSTNRLLSNDLLARLTARTAEAGAPKVTTETRIPQTTSISQSGTQGGIGKDGMTDAGKLMLAMKAYNELGGSKGIKKGIGSLGALLGGDAMADMTGFMSPDAAPNAMNAFADMAGFTGQSSDLAASALPMSQDLMSGGNDFMSFMFSSPDTASMAESVAPVVSDAVSSVDTAAVAEDTTNFSQASAQISANGGTAGPSNSEVLAGANSPSADTTSLTNTADATSAAAGAYDTYSAAQTGLGTATAGISYGSQTASSVGSLSTGYDLGSGVTQAGGTTTSLAGAGSGADAASSGGGSVLGYIGPIMNAFNAQNNPKGEQNPDYRKAVGGAILNYFGFGWATPIVDAVARPALDASMEAGYESLGNFGVVMADPIGAPLSGQYDVKDLVTSTLDPGNIFGGNEGGSVGAVVAMGVDPIGAMLGDKGVFGEVSDAVNKVDSALSPGRVVCTELALAGHLPIEKYQRVIQPDLTLRGRVLLGYHVLGIPAVRKLRADPVFTARALPYVNAYLDHKLGKHNWRGWLIKNLGEPLCWMLSFFNRDPEAYKTLYPYRRNRNG